MSAKTLPGNTQTSHHHQQQQHYQQPTTRPLFLVLVDDNRGSNHQGGAYAATFVTLQHCVFTVSKLTTPPFLPTFQECHVSRIMNDADLFCVLVRDSGQSHPLHFSRMLL